MMSYISPIAIAFTKCDRQNFIHASELTEGDIIRHFTGDKWLVVSEPQYTCSGITFDVMWLDVQTLDNTQSVTFAPQWKFELVTHLSSAIAVEAA